MSRISFAIAVASGLLVAKSSFALDELETEYSGLDTKVFTPALMVQSIADTPGAVTIITAKQIKELGINTIGEALRLVPGFQVEYSTPWLKVNRGPNIPTPRRFQVLVDGVSEVNPLVGVVTYESFPVALERIQRIEVVRSQSSAAYGANAFYGTINIITTHPDDIVGYHASGSASKNGNTLYAGGAVKGGNTTVAIDLKNIKEDRFDEMIVPEGATSHDDMNVTMASVNSVTRLKDNSEVSLAVKGTAGKYDSESGRTVYGQTYPIADMDTLVVDGSYKFFADNHVVTVSGSTYDKDWDYHWPICAPRAFFYPALGELYRDNRDLVLAAVNNTPLPAATPEQLQRLGTIFGALLADPTSFNTICGETNVDYRYRTNVASVNDVWAISDALRISTSAQIEHRRWVSETYNDGTTSLEKSKLFSNAEYALSSNFIVNLGFMAESLGYGLGNPEFSPRAGASYHLNDWNIVKAVVSEGKRLIDGIEIIDKNQIPTHFSEPVYGSTVQSGFPAYFPLYQNEDHVEKIRSYEVIFYSDPSFANLETRYFVEDLSNVLNYQDGDVSNIADFQREGGEFSILFPLSSLDIRLAGHYMESRSNSQFDEYNSYGGSAYVIRRFSGGWTAALAYYGTSALEYSSFDRTDFRIGKTLTDGTTVAELGLTLRHHRDEYLSAISNGTYEGGTYDPVNELIVDASIKF